MHLEKAGFVCPARSVHFQTADSEKEDINERIYTF